MTKSFKSDPLDVELARRRKQKVMQFLRELHPEKMRSLELYDEIIADSEKVLQEEAYEPQIGAVEDFSRFDTVPDAAAAYLKAKGPTRRAVLASELVRGGFGDVENKSQEERMKNVQSALTYHLTQARHKIIGMGADRVLYLLP